MSSTPNALANAKKALDDANNFTKSVTGGKPNAFAPKAKAQAESSDYSHVRAARKPEGSFMGVEASEKAGQELKSAAEQHEQNKKALEQ